MIVKVDMQHICLKEIQAILSSSEGTFLIVLMVLESHSCFSYIAVYYYTKSLVWFWAPSSN